MTLQHGSKTPENKIKATMLLNWKTIIRNKSKRYKYTRPEKAKGQLQHQLQFSVTCCS